MRVAQHASLSQHTSGMTYEHLETFSQGCEECQLHSARDPGACAYQTLALLLWQWRPHQCNPAAQHPDDQNCRLAALRGLSPDQDSCMLLSPCKVEQITMSSEATIDAALCSAIQAASRERHPGKRPTNTFCMLRFDASRRACLCPGRSKSWRTNSNPRPLEAP